MDSELELLDKVQKELDINGNYNALQQKTLKNIKFENINGSLDSSKISEVSNTLTELVVHHACKALGGVHKDFDNFALAIANYITYILMVCSIADIIIDGFDTDKLSIMGFKINIQKADANYDDDGKFYIAIPFRAKNEDSLLAFWKIAIRDFDPLNYKKFLIINIGELLNLAVNHQIYLIDSQTSKIILNKILPFNINYCSLTTPAIKQAIKEITYELWKTGRVR